MVTLTDDLHTWLGQSRRRIGNFALEPRLEQVGHVAQIGDGVATVNGLPETRLDELLVFTEGVRGLAVDLGEETIGCVLLATPPELPRAAWSAAQAGWRVYRSATLYSGASSTRSGYRLMAARLLLPRPLLRSSSRHQQSSTGHW